MGFFNFITREKAKKEAENSVLRENQPTKNIENTQKDIKNDVLMSKEENLSDILEKEEEISLRMQELGIKSAQSRQMINERRNIANELKRIEQEKLKIKAQLELEKAKFELEELKAEMWGEEEEDEKNSSLTGNPNIDAMILGLVANQIKPQAMQPEAPQPQAMQPRPLYIRSLSDEYLKEVSQKLPQNIKEHIKNIETGDLIVLQDMIRNQ